MIVSSLKITKYFELIFIHLSVPSDHEAEELATVSKKENPTEWWMQICPEEELNNLEHSSKLLLLFSILEECEAIGDKL